MIRQAKQNTRWLPLLLVLLCSCNILDFDFKKVEFGTWEDYPNFDFPSLEHRYIDEFTIAPFPRFPGDSLTITCLLHDSLSTTDFTFNWKLDHYSALPEGVARHNIYKTVAPDSAGTYWISVLIHSDNTLSDTLDYKSVGIIVEDPN